MTDKNILYLYDVCGLTVDAIALQSGLTIDRVKLIVSGPPKYPLTYTPRHTYK
jgi:hypothetical protein